MSNNEQSKGSGDWVTEPLALPFESDQASGPCNVLGTFIEEMILKCGGLTAVAIETTALSRRQMAIAVLGKFPGAKVDS